MSMQGLETLNAWRKAKEYVVRIYKEALPLLPPEEKWGMNSQLRRSSQSIPANIAEGHGRYYYQDNVRFCYMARGSLQETLSHLTLAWKLGYLGEDLYKRLVHEGEELERVLNGYITYLKRTRQGEHEPGANLTVRESPEIYDPFLDSPDDSNEPSEAR